jgi:hypothetical protein
VQAPSRVVFTEHAADRAVRFAVPYSAVTDVILGRHQGRARNIGRGDWLIRAGNLVVIYDWPDRGDPVTARAVTLWVEE